MIHKLDQVLALFSLDRTELTGPEIAALIKRPKSTVYRLLASFTGAGYLDQDRDTGRYRVGIRLAALGDVARHSTSIQRQALLMLRDLTEATGELADLTVLADTQLVTIEVGESASDQGAGTTGRPSAAPCHRGRQSVAGLAARA